MYDGTYNQARQTDLALIDSGVPIGFFPLDAYNDLNNLTATAGDSSLTHSLGMSIDTSFKLSASGKVDGEDLTFEYTGDDDAWLFIDDVLVLDAGGIHSKLNASVDFATGEVSVGSASALEAAERTIGRGSTLEQIFADAGKTWKQEGTHTLRFYSLERDGGQSDLVIKTNLWKVVDTELTDVTATKEWVDVDGNECDPWLDSVTVQLYQTVDGTTTKVDGKTLTLSADNDWTDAFTSLPATDDDGNRITYSVKEEQADGVFPTYEVGGVTQSTKVYWVRYDASNGVEPGIYAVLSMDGDQPVLLTSREAEGEEIEYTDVFFESGPVTDGATGDTYEQYISPVRDNEIWTISRTTPQQYVTRAWDYSDGYQVTDDGYTVYSPSPNYPGQFYVKDDKVYVKDSSGKYQPVMGTVSKESDTSYRITNDSVSITSVPTGDFERNDDGYIILMMQTGPATYSTYYTTDDWKDVYRQNPNGTYTKVVEGSVPTNYFPRPLYDTTEDGYVVLKGDDGNTYYGDQNNGTVYRKTSDGSYAPVMLGTLYIYALPSYTEDWSDDFEWQIANQGLYLTLVGPGQQWMDYTYVTSTNEEQHVTNDMVQGDAASSSGWNYRNVFRLDLWKDYERNYGGGDSTLSYDDAGLRIYSFQGLWQFTGLITGYEKNLAVSSSYNTKETYMTQQAGSYWLYKPIYEEAPLKLADTDWTVVNHPAGDLAITKSVTGAGASTSDEFTFTIKLTGETDAAKALVNEVNGTFGDIDFVGGMATVTLRGGETKTARNLPAGISYTVTETVLPGYTLAGKDGDSGTIPVRSTVTASFTNDKDASVTLEPTPTPAKPAKPAKMARAAVPATGDATVSAALVAALAGVGCGLVGVTAAARRIRRRQH